MGRISASGAQDLYNAYASVYKTTEEDFSEIESLCEEWLQEKIEEEFDFSQYTIEELAEAIQGGLMDRAKQDGAARRDAQGAAFKSFADRGGVLGFLQRRLQGTRDRVQRSRGQGNQPLRQPGDPGRTSQPTTRIDRSPSTPAPAPNPAATSRPAPNPAATSRPAPSATTPAAKPASATTPAAKPSTSVAGTFKPVPGAPTQQSLATARPAQKPEQALSKLPGGNYSAAATKLMSQRTKNILGTTKTPATRLGGARERMLNQDLDLFDIVKGHLMSEGYADTEEAALAIMANMSEEWKQTILEADSVDKMRERAEKRRQQRYGKQGGGGRDDYRPYTEDDYKNPKPGYGSSQVKPA